MRVAEQRLHVSSNYKRQKGIYVPTETAGVDQEPSKRVRLVYQGRGQRLTSCEEH